MSRLLELEGRRTYAGAGVSVEAGDEAVDKIRRSVARTRRPEVLGDLGAFAGLFALDLAAWRSPVLVASTDGVGTKLEIARRLNRYESIGTDLVSMVVDDLACAGATPLFLLDYVAVGALDPAKIEVLVASIAEACAAVGATLLGGETAEHAGVMRPDDLDVAAFALGVVERDEILGPTRVRDGDVLVGLHSPGLRSNGFALARDILVSDDDSLRAPAYSGAAHSLADELLAPSVLYTPSVLALCRALGQRVHAGAHVTGGGIASNVARVIPAGLSATIDLESFPTPEIFYEIQRRGPVSADEMTRVFNCGLGFVIALEADALNEALEVVAALGVGVSAVGDVRRGDEAVTWR